MSTWLDEAIQERQQQHQQTLDASDTEVKRRDHVMANAIGTAKGFDELIREHLSNVADATWEPGSYTVTPPFAETQEQSLRDHMAAEPGLPAYVWLASSQRTVFRVALYLNEDGRPAYFRHDDPPAGQPTLEGLGQNFPATEEGLETLLTQQFRAGPHSIPGTASEQWARTFGH